MSQYVRTTELEGGGHLPCHLLLCTHILSLQEDIFESSWGTRPWWSPVVSVLMERSPEIQESSSRCSPCWATGDLELYGVFPRRYLHQRPHVVVQGGTMARRACDPFCALFGYDKWGVCSFVPSAARSTNRVQVGCGRIIASLFLLIFFLSLKGNVKPDFVLSVECCPRPARRPPHVFTGLHRSG